MLAFAIALLDFLSFDFEKYSCHKIVSAFGESCSSLKPSADSQLLIPTMAIKIRHGLHLPLIYVSQSSMPIEFEKLIPTPDWRTCQGLLQHVEAMDGHRVDSIDYLLGWARVVVSRIVVCLGEWTIYGDGILKRCPA
jgi:hypothetical protein